MCKTREPCRSQVARARAVMTEQIAASFVRTLAGVVAPASATTWQTSRLLVASPRARGGQGVEDDLGSNLSGYLGTRVQRLEYGALQAGHAHASHTVCVRRST